MSNWKSPGPDGVQGYRIKNIKDEKKGNEVASNRPLYLFISAVESTHWCFMKKFTIISNNIIYYQVPHHCLILCVLCASSCQNMSILCLMGDLFLDYVRFMSLITVTGPSINDVGNKGESVHGKWAPLEK